MEGPFGGLGGGDGRALPPEALEDGHVVIIVLLLPGWYRLRVWAPMVEYFMLSRTISMLDCKGLALKHSQPQVRTESLKHC